ncbi:hypothetical protein RB195_000373 [Necator americanus]|uniref:Uncharacterized protein n=1 Tax=Necator americanus TaxID=51031 RepID=A0ABR1DA39_NECAM
MTIVLVFLDWSFSWMGRTCGRQETSSIRSRYLGDGNPEEVFQVFEFVNCCCILFLVAFVQNSLRNVLPLAVTSTE